MIKIINLTSIVHPNGTLVAMEADADVPVAIRRIFVVSGKQGATRGKHAHKTLTQVLVCVHGTCRVVCDDGKIRQEVTLDRPDLALEIPPGIWAEQYYEEPDTVLMVLCDMPYDEGDYIRDYEQFMDSRRGAHP